MKRTHTAEEMRLKLLEIGSASKIAKKLGVSYEYARLLVNGRRSLSTKLAKKMGYWKFTYYVEEP